ncbi:MAG: hypothetical protein DME82_00640, partial [Verrucomicrobia bacterium]
ESGRLADANGRSLTTLSHRDRKRIVGQAYRLPSLWLATPKAFGVALQLTCATVRPMELASELRKLVGNEIVSNDPETLVAHGGDKWFAAHQPDVVVFAR